MPGFVEGAANTVFWALVWTIMGGILLAVFGLLFAPVAGTVCSLIAWIKQYPRAASYWGTGAWYSILLVAPWVYLVVRMAGLRPPDVLVRIWYIVFFGYWSLCVLSLLAMSIFQLVVEREPEASLLMAMVGAALGVVEFAVVRRLARRRTPNSGDASWAMRRAYILLQALWLGSLVCFVFVGLRQLIQFDKPYGTTALMALAVLMVLVWWVVRSSVRLHHVDSLDFPGRNHSRAGVPDRIYTEPFAVLWVMATTAMGVTVAGWILIVIIDPTPFY